MSESARELKRRIGVLGGTFDPIHIGHLVVAVNARHLLSLDRVLLVVANQPWQKVGTRPISDASVRFALCAAAVRDVEGIDASRIDIDRGGLTYSADTLKAVEADEPGSLLFLIVGADVAAGLSSWKRLEEVSERAALVVVNRPGVAHVKELSRLYESPHGVYEIEVPLIGVSSSDIRERLAKGAPIDYLVPTESMRMIDEIELYDRGR